MTFDPTAAPHSVPSQPVAWSDGEAHFQAVWDAAGDAMALSNPDGIVLLANPAYYDLYGYTPEEVIGRSFALIFPPAARAAAEAAYRRTFADPVIAPSVESTIRRKDGATRIVETHYTFINRDGARTAMISIIRDITARRAAEEELRRKEEELRDFLENAALGLHWVGPDGTILWANPAELDLLGYGAGEYIGHHIGEFHADSDVIDDILRRLTANETLHNYEARLRAKDGSIKHVLITSNVRWEDGRFIHTRCFTRDITLRKQAQEERDQLLAQEQAARLAAEAALRTRDELLSVVSHDLNTPLAGIKGYAQLMQRHMAQAQAPDRAQLTRWVGQIEQLTTRMSLLIRELLDFANLQDARPLALYCKTTDLVALCRQGVAQWQPTAPGHRIHLVVQAPAVVGCWDAYRLERVLGNLLSNAVKYSPSGTPILVTVGREDGPDGPLAVLAVADQGMGIPEADLPHIFDWYRRAGNVRREISGAGIGLASVRQIVQQHHGTVHVTSTEGAGSTFTLRLPLAPPQ